MKRLFALLLVMLIAFGTVVTASASVVYGDVNLDGDVNIIDATEIQYFVASLVELSSSSLENADVDADGEVSVMDATCIKLYLANLIDKFPSEESEQNLSLYRPYIKGALNEHDGMGYYDALGCLCDVDSNGIYELVLLYTIPDAKVPSGDFEYYGDVYSIYTMDGDKVIPLVEKELFFMHAGGPSGDVYLMNNGEESFLGFRYTEANPYNEQAWTVYGYWDFYEIEGTDLKQSRCVEYNTIQNDSTIDYSRSYVIEDEVKSSYEDFEEWLNSFDSQLLLSSYSEDSLNSLELLYDELA